MNNKSVLINKETNVLLSDDQKRLINKYIVQIRNKTEACEIADLHVITLNKALKKDGSLRQSQLDKLMQYCEAVRRQATKGA